jgi:hypothetical protein|nr:MAG TPA: Endodeoxyribonuclease RusA [Caudoviricetes sp.]
MTWQYGEQRQFAVFGNPMGKQRPKFSTFGKYGKAYTPEKTVNYETLVKMTYLEKYRGVPPLGKPVTLRVVAWYPLPVSWSKKKRERALCGHIFPIVKPDLDNVAKIICDALNGIAYVDDKQIVEVMIQKLYADCPRVEIGISEVEDGCRKE